jgi:putative SOS response-associated peptidase YedK
MEAFSSSSRRGFGLLVSVPAYLFGPKSGKLLAFAGLGEEDCTLTILTTTANELAADVHNLLASGMPTA